MIRTDHEEPALNAFDVATVVVCVVTLVAWACFSFA